MNMMTMITMTLVMMMTHLFDPTYYPVVFQRSVDSRLHSVLKNTLLLLLLMITSIIIIMMTIMVMMMLVIKKVTFLSR